VLVLDAPSLMRLYQEVVDAVRKRDEHALDVMIAEGIHIDEADHQILCPTPACLMAFEADIEGLEILRYRSPLNENMIAYGFALGGHFELLKTHCLAFNVKKDSIAKGIVKGIHVDLVERCINELALSPEMVALFFAMDNNYLMACHYQAKFNIDPRILFEGFARSGNLSDVLVLSLNHSMKPDSVIYNFCFGGYADLAKEFYLTLPGIEKTCIDLDRLTILGLALGGHTQQVEGLRGDATTTVNEIAYFYALGGCYEAAEAYRQIHDVPAASIARGFAYGGWYSYAQHYYQQFKVDSAVIVEGFREGGHSQLLDAFEQRFKTTSKPYIQVARFFGSDNQSVNQADNGKAEVVCDDCTFVTGKDS